jgi:hypothetical protein
LSNQTHIIAATTVGTAQGKINIVRTRALPRKLLFNINANIKPMTRLDKTVPAVNTKEFLKLAQNVSLLVKRYSKFFKPTKGTPLAGLSRFLEKNASRKEETKGYKTIRTSTSRAGEINNIPNLDSGFQIACQMFFRDRIDNDTSEKCFKIQLIQ